MKESDFLHVDEKGKSVVVKINAKMFPIDLVYDAAYSMLGRAYVILDGNPNEEVFAILTPRNFKGDLQELGRIFYDEIVNSSFYAVQLMRNKDVRTALVESITPFSKESDEDVVELWEDRFTDKEEGADCLERDNKKRK